MFDSQKGSASHTLSLNADGTTGAGTTSCCHNEGKTNLSSGKTYITVAVALPVFSTFTYEVPSRLVPVAAVGKRVLVPFKNLTVTAYVLEANDATDQDGVKEIFDVLDDTPMFPESMVRFFSWISDYYRYPIGEVIRGALPGGLNFTQVETVRITEKGYSMLGGTSPETINRAVLEVLATMGPMRVRRLCRECGDKVSPETLRNLDRSGCLAREREFKPGRVRPKTEPYVVSANQRPPADSLSQARSNILNTVENYGQISLRALKGHFPYAGRLVNRMAADGFLTLVDRRVYRDPFGETIESDYGGPVLSGDQAAVVDNLVDALDKGFSTYLLYGITGSGKTEVYMRAVAEALERGRQALVLVPEIALVSQMESIFRARFGECVALLHSGLSEGERLDQWIRIVEGKATVAIGARSAIFAPFEKIGIIVVDEEHDDSYKQETKLRYHARDLAVVRAKLHGAVALLGSATPSVQSYHNVLSGKFQGLNLTRRIEDRGLPEVTVIDLRDAKGPRRTKPFITKDLRLAMEETLSRGEQALLFLNRRGFANFSVCLVCGAPVHCRNCDITMTLHQETNTLKCHYCGYATAQAVGCPVCGSAKVRAIGLGTEKVEARIREIFPEARVARMDRDATSRKGALLSILKGLRSGDIDILIGTQMVAKGHDYPNITLVGIICADLSLNFPDFRACERTFQLLAQVAGRAGRGARPGRVILQTFNPDHYSILTAKEQDYKAFYEKEIGFRSALRYPPFSRLIQILISGTDKGRTAEYALSLGQICRGLQSANRSYRDNVQLLGPVSAPLARLQRRYRWQLLLKGLKPGPLHGLSRELLEKAERTMKKGGIRVVVDVDPVDML